ncbi:DUF1566 domain-containing protein [Candidatus Halobeggiatoa sp. HSG11]|nr:DUF1566 domain-containing protein [Candidatus Halobeggiatoa sp. HSG11]
MALPKTGRTINYATGDDGDLKVGTAWPNPRFSDNSNGTVTDNLTGLIWLKDANCTETLGGIDPTATSNQLTWADSFTWIAALASGDCGLTDSSSVGDWRLPNRVELESLLNLEYSSPSLSNAAGDAKWSEGDDAFTGVQSSNYLSSTTCADSAGYAWVVDLNNGYVGYGNMDNGSYVWPVRGGQ